MKNKIQFYTATIHRHQRHQAPCRVGGPLGQRDSEK